FIVDDLNKLLSISCCLFQENLMGIHCVASIIIGQRKFFLKNWNLKISGGFLIRKPTFIGLNH
ncbi:hypothetical protein, partial [Acinetobacter pragensis]|uniref:hypothetical protein n=1 Tax=Acinetobacter pragensis TaxID=1806892 RepID=UPI0039EEDA4D